MAEDRTATLNMRRRSRITEEEQWPREESLRIEILSPSDLSNAAPEVVRSLEQGEPISVYSFKDVVEAASVFYDVQGPGDIVLYGIRRGEKEANNEGEKTPLQAASHSVPSEPPQSLGSNPYWPRNWIIMSSFVAGLAIAIIYWGSTVNHATVVFAGIITFTAAVLSWLVPIAVFSKWVISDLKRFIRRKSAPN